MNKLSIIFLIVLIALAIVFLIVVKNEGSKCMADPFKFSLDMLQKQTDKPVTCSCTSGDRTVIITNNKDDSYSFTELDIKNITIK